MTGDDHDLHCGVPLPDQPHGLEPVHARHEDIEEQQVEILALELIQSAAAVIGGKDLMPGALQQQADDGLHVGSSSTTRIFAKAGGLRFAANHYEESEANAEFDCPLKSRVHLPGALDCARQIA